MRNVQAKRRSIFIARANCNTTTLAYTAFPLTTLGKHKHPPSIYLKLLGFTLKVV